MKYKLFNLVYSKCLCSEVIFSVICVVLNTRSVDVCILLLLSYVGGQ